MILSAILVVFYSIYTMCRCSEVNPDLKPLLKKLNVDEKYHGFANEMYNEADKTLTKEKSPMKHMQALNISVRMLLNTVPGPDKLFGTEAETMGKKILQYAKEEFSKHEIAEASLKSKYNMNDEDIAKFKELYLDTKRCVDKLNVLFECV